MLRNYLPLLAGGGHPGENIRSYMQSVRNHRVVRCIPHQLSLTPQGFPAFCLMFAAVLPYQLLHFREPLLLQQL